MGVYLDEYGNNQWAPPEPSATDFRDALKDCVGAMEKSVTEGCTDYLDAGDDGSDWWYGPIERAKKLLAK